MTRELMWLTLTLILTGVLWIPYIIDRAMVRGLMGSMANPTRNDKPQSPWAQRSSSHFCYRPGEALMPWKSTSLEKKGS